MANSSFYKKKNRETFSKIKTTRVLYSINCTNLSRKLHQFLFITMDASKSKELMDKSISIEGVSSKILTEKLEDANEAEEVKLVWRISNYRNSERITLSIYHCDTDVF